MALIGGLLGGFCKIMLKQAPILMDFFMTYIQNKQKIELAKIQVEQKIIQPSQLISCNNFCQYKPINLKNVSLKQEHKMWRKLRISIIGIISVLLILYLIIDFTYFSKYYLDINEIKSILTSYRETALGLLMFIIMWALAGNAEKNILTPISKK